MSRPIKKDDKTIAENSTYQESKLVRQLGADLKTRLNDLLLSVKGLNSANQGLTDSNGTLEKTNDELQALNEELIAVSEELTTVNEELTGVNEEICIVNTQLQHKIEALSKSYIDVNDLLNSSKIATLFLDTHLNITLFTEMTGKLLGLQSRDIGHPVRISTSELIGTSLETDAREVLEKLAPVERFINTSDTGYFLRRAMPYRSSDSHISGLVVTFIDITRRYQSEEQVRRMAKILQDSSDAISVINFDGSISAWNHGAELLYGYSEAEALNMNISDLTATVELNEELVYLQRIEQGDNVDAFDSTRLTKDGRRVNVWVTVTPLYDEKGKPIAVATTERDITDRILLDKLRIQTDRLFRMVEHLPIGAVYREGNNLIMNRAAEEITGYSRKELSTVGDWFKCLFGEKSAEMQQLYNQDREAWFPEKTQPIEHTRKNGERRYVEYSGYRFDDHEVWLMHDATSRQQRETEILNRKKRLRAVMNHVAEAIIVIHLDGTIADFNKAAVRLFGYSADEAIGQNVTMLIPSPYRELHDLGLANNLKNDKPFSDDITLQREFPGLRKDGSTLPLFITVTSIQSESVYVCIMRDLSEQKKLEREVAEISTQEQVRMGQEIHDGLGQQLTGISLIVSSIKQKYKKLDADEIVEELGEVGHQINIALEEARRVSRGLAPVPIMKDGLPAAIRLLAEGVRKMGIECNVEVNDDVKITDQTDALQAYRIVQEALNNALKHANASKIDICLGASESHCELSITDNGIGFETDVNLTDGLGTRIMRYRAGIVGSNLNIESSPGKGTVVRCKKTILGTPPKKPA